MQQHPNRASAPPSGKRFGLGRKLLGWFLVLSLVPLGASSALGYLRSRSIIEGLVARYLGGIAEAQAVHVGDQVREQLLLLERFSQAVEYPDDPDSGEAHEAALGTIFEQEPSFEALFIFDAQGRVLTSTPLDPSDLRPWLTQTLEPPIEPVRISWSPTIGEAPTLRLSAPIGEAPDRDAQRFLGALVILQGGGQFLEIPAHVAGTVESFVLAADGRPLFVSHPHGHVDYSIPLASPLLASSNGRSARYEDRLGVMVIGTVVPVPGMDWRVITEAPVELALAELARLRRVSLLLAGAFAVLVILSSSFVTTQIVAPLRRLVAGVRRIGAGDLDARVDATAKDEVGELGVAFNQMADDLARASSEVDALHKREMERASQLATVGELASGLAHEIKNPVVGISNGLDLVMRRTQSVESLAPITTEMKRQLARIELAVRDLLAFARPADPRPESTSAQRLVERALALSLPAAERAGVDLSVDAPDDAIELRVDESMIVQVLVNLIVNGIQAAEPDGVVHVVSRVVGSRGVIEVRDDGGGIPRDRLQTIFKPFFTTKHRGTGLGLSISKGIVETHGGSLTVESREGEGSAFFIELPLDGTIDGAREPQPVDPNP
jgi:signal transduction histidine kinase